MTTSSPSILITGASTGIGLASAKLFQSKGWQVFAGYRSDEDGQVLAALGCTPLYLDVADPQAISVAIAELENSLGDNGLNYLINNAGLATAAPLEHIPIDDFKYQMAVNVEGVLLVTQACLPLIRKSTASSARQARIVNVSSVSGLIAYPALGAYCASKFALEALSDSLRMELLAHDIDVIVVHPGPVKTPIWQRSTAAGRKRMEVMNTAAEKDYGQLMTAMMNGAEESERYGIEASRVAKTIETALISRKPKTRYLVGNGMRRLLWFARLLPERRRDRIFMKKLGCV